MNLKLVLFSAACLSVFVIPAAGTSLMAAAAAAKGAIIGAGLAGVALGGAGGETVVIQAGQGTQAAHEHQVLVQQPLVYKPVHPISLVPVATISSSNSFADSLSNQWSGISKSISTKTRAVGEFLQSFHRRPQIVLISVDKTTTTTTTTTKKPTTKNPHQPVILEIIASPHERIAYPFRVPVPVPLVEDYVKK